MSRIKSCNVNFGSSVTVGQPDNDLEKEEEARVQKAMADTLEAVTTKSQNILRTAEIEAEALLMEANAKKLEIEAQVEQIRENAKKQGYQEGFDKGYFEGNNEINEKMSEKVESVELFASSNFEIKKKILDSSREDMLNLCFEICKKVGIIELDGAVLEQIIKRAIRLLDSKTVVTVMISENLASKLGPDFEYNFQSVRVVSNPKIADDAIIVESLSGNVDASISSQIEKIASELLNG